MAYNFKPTNDYYGRYKLENTVVEQVILPSTLRVLGDSTFYRCCALKSVIFREGCKLEQIGKRCFAESGLEEFVAPSRLRKIDAEAFLDCKNLKRVVLNEGL